MKGLAQQDGNLPHFHFFISDSGEPNIAFQSNLGRYYSRPIVPQIVYTLSKPVIEERELAAINCYIMGKDETYDTTMSGENSYRSKYNRGFVLSNELSLFIKRYSFDKKDVKNNRDKRMLECVKQELLDYLYRTILGSKYKGNLVCNIDVYQHDGSGFQTYTFTVRRVYENENHKLIVDFDSHNRKSPMHLDAMSIPELYSICSKLW